MTASTSPRRALAIGASDSSGAAGIQADLKTFEARQVYGLCALTALTAQDSARIHGLQVLEAGFVAAQVRVVLADAGAHAIKTGMLLRREIIDAVALNLASTDAPLIIDPVLVDGRGRALVDEAGIAAYRERLFPRALIITPNLHEAELLTGQPVATVRAMRGAARALFDLGPRYVLVKGGHLAGGDMVDVLFDGRDLIEMPIERLPSANARGAGCTFAACITAEVARGRDVADAVRVAQRYLAATLRGALDWRIGEGRGALFHAVGRPPLFDEG
ncbi:MAG: bifunctional hydroxymethylpyrimidine kinase/phosphomethylpyrimidine kinase [Anaerolineae bacterium]|nr:bifunctional hydroxymethylpyrimidine kinase/phosphomethylpyrimidine kinase [Anaerolineae bacterium]